MFSIALLFVSAVWIAFEIALVVARRSNAHSSRRDAGSLRLLNIVIYTCVALAMILAGRGVGRIELPLAISWGGFSLIVLGLVLRAWAVVTLRRFFTVDVAIAREHRLIQKGPYKFVRHPAYAGSLLSFVGLAVCSSSWISAMVIVVPIAAAFSYRIRIEEAALRSAFPDEYPAYSSRTARLLPGVF